MLRRRLFASLRRQQAKPGQSGCCVRQQGGFATNPAWIARLWGIGATAFTGAFTCRAGLACYYFLFHTDSFRQRK